MPDSRSDLSDESIESFNSNNLILALENFTNDDPAVKSKAKSFIKSLSEESVSLKMVIETDILKIYHEMFDIQEECYNLKLRGGEIQKDISDKKALISDIAKKYGISKMDLAPDEVLKKIYDSIEKKRIDQINKKGYLESKIESLERQKKDLENKVRTIQTLNTQRDEIKENIKKQKIEIQNSYSSNFRPFTYTDKPITRFMVYCGDFAEDFLYDSVSLHLSSITPSHISFKRPHLPSWFIENYQEWWNTKKDAERNNLSGEDRSGARSPYLSFDYSKANLKLIIPEQVFSDGDVSECYLVVMGGTKIISEKWIPLYDDEKGVITEQCAIPVEFPSALYSVEMSVAGDAKSWIIDGIVEERPYLLFDYDNGKMLKGNAEITKKFCIILHESQNIQPDEVILESSKLYGDWGQYWLYVVDPEGYGRICIGSVEDDQHPELNRNPLDVLFQTDKKEPSLRVNDQPTFIDSVPLISILFEDKHTLLKSQISIHPLCESTLDKAKFISFSENANILIIDEQKGKCTIDLSSEYLLGPNSFGSFVVRIRNSDCRLSATYAFSLVRHFTYSFSEPIYLVDSRDRVHAKIRCPPNVHIEVDTPGDVRKEAWGYTWKGKSESRVTGILTYHLNKDRAFSYPFAISIPQFGWCFETGKKDSAHPIYRKSLTLSDFDYASLGRDLSLSIYLPDKYEGNGSLFLNPGDQYVSARVSEGQGRFSLSRFEDTISTIKDSKIDFCFSLDSEKNSIDHTVLFSLIRWYINDFSYVFNETDNGVRALILSWDENDTVKNRSIILWKMGKNESKARRVVTVNIPDGKYDHTIVINRKEFSAGIYYVQFIRRVDDWAVPQVEFAGESVRNIFQITVELESKTLLEDGDAYMASGKYLEAIECYKELQRQNLELGEIWKQKIMNVLIYPKDFHGAFTLFYQLLNNSREMSETDYSFIAFRIFSNILRPEYHLAAEMWFTAIKLLKGLGACGSNTVRLVILDKSERALDQIRASHHLSFQEKQSIIQEFNVLIECCRI